MERLRALMHSRDSSLLVLVRLVRSISQGALVVDFALYLRALHWSGGAIGGLLAASMASGIVLTAIFGPLSDRIGRKRLLLGFEATRILAALVAMLTSSPALLAAAAIAGQYGRGGNGSAGPFGAVEQAWLAHSVPSERRVGVYSLNSAMGFLGRTVGALLAGLPGLFSLWLPGPLAYRPLFGLVAVTSVIAMILIARVPDDGGARRVRATPAPAPRPPRGKENALLLRLALANLLQGAGIGLSGPLIAYWFALRFHQGPGIIGPLMAAGFLLAALASLGTGRMARRHGIVPVVIGMRTVGLGLLVALPLAPSLPVAGTIYVTRSLFNRGTNGVRAALSIGLVRSERRGFAASLNSVSVSVPRALGPLLAGLLFEAHFLVLPFMLAAGFQAAYLWLYGTSFAAHDRASRAAAAPAGARV